MNDSIENNRVIGQFQGDHKGPLLICFAGIHGNEWAGIRALESVFRRLEEEEKSNPNFQFQGRIVGLRGNLQALKLNQRFIKEDLNRIWKEDRLLAVTKSSVYALEAEELEMKAIIEAVNREVMGYEPEKIIAIDLHTTSAEGGVFTAAFRDADSIKIGKSLHAPVVLGLFKGLKGTLLHYFNPDRFEIPVTKVAFESGQHQDPLSIDRAIGGLINCLTTIGCVQPNVMENNYSKILRSYSEGLPIISELTMVYQIKNPDRFRMMPGFRNFQFVRKGTILAEDQTGEVVAPYDAIILMPLYQKQGSNGFFLIQPLEEN